MGVAAGWFIILFVYILEGQRFTKTQWYNSIFIAPMTLSIHKLFLDANHNQKFFNMDFLLFKFKFFQMDLSNYFDLLN
jgi:hypothetical protein